MISEILNFNSGFDEIKEVKYFKAITGFKSLIMLYTLKKYKV